MVIDSSEAECPNGGVECPCAEYSKDMVCDSPFRNTELEIKAIRLWGHRLNIRLWSVGELKRWRN